MGQGQKCLKRCPPDAGRDLAKPKSALPMWDEVVKRAYICSISQTELLLTNT